jgi:hypothetical protein
LRLAARLTNVKPENIMESSWKEEAASGKP